MTAPVVALITDPALLGGIPEAWRARHPDQADRVAFVLPSSAETAALHEVGAEASVLFGCRTTIGESLLSGLPRVRLVQQCSAGTDNVDLQALASRNITLARVEGSGVTAVAEHTVMMMLALARRLCEANRSTHDAQWAFDRFYDTIWELRGKQVGIVGMGAIGREVGRLVTAFGATVVYTRLSDADVVDLGYEARRVDLAELLATSRVVSLHCPLTHATRGLIDAGALGRMRADALLVNTARGAIAVEADVAGAVRDGVIAGAAIDTFGSHSDPIDVDSPLRGLQRVLLTPHTAGSTSENLDYTFHQAGLENLAAWLDGRPLRGQIPTNVEAGRL